MDFDSTFVPAKNVRANLITFILSNDFDYLIGQLKGQLYAKSNILTRKLLVVPCDELLRFFEKRCLEDLNCGINFGYRSVNLNLCIEIIAQTIDPAVNFPTRQALRLALMELILKKKASNDQEVENLNKYLDSQPISLSFFNSLTTIFSSYALHGMNDLVDERLSWQKIILNELGLVFDFPSKILEKHLVDPRVLAGMEIHLLGFTMIPPEYLEFFMKISTIVPIYFYFPSVSKEMTLDFLSNFSDDLNPLEKNPLLANFQGAFRQNLKFLIDESSYQKEDFFLGKSRYEEFQGTISLRKALIESLLSAKTMLDQSKKTVTLNEDFLVIEAPHPAREVEEMVEFIKRKVTLDGVQLNEIVIICSNLTEYSPLLAFEFEQNGLGYLINGKFNFSDSIDGEIETFLKTIVSRFEKKDLLKVLSCKFVMRQLGIEEKSSLNIKKMVESSTITFGFDRDHRLSILKNCHPKDLYNGTVEHFFDQIYLGCIFSNDQLDFLEFGSAEKLLDPQMVEDLSRFYNLIVTMNAMRLKIKEAKLSLNEWILQFLSLIGANFGKEKALNFRSFFQNELDITQNEPISGDLFFEMALEKIQDKRSVWASESKNQILCTSFEEGKFFGKKLIYILGADDQFLPKWFEKSSLDLTPADCIITPLQKQKAIFLQILGLNSNYLVFSFSKIGFDQNEKILSLFVQKVLQYVEGYFEDETGASVVKNIYKKVKGFNFSQVTFERIHFDQRGFRLFQSLSGRKPSNMPIIMKRSSFKEQTEIQIKELKLLLKNPVRFFVQQALKLQLPFLEENREFHLPNYQRRKILENSLKRDIELYFSQLKFRGIFPQYGFSDLFFHQLKNDSYELKENFERSPFSGRKGRIILFKKNLPKLIYESDQLIELPAVNITSNCGKLVYVCGKLEEITQHHLMIPSQLKQGNLFQYWPEILMYGYCSKLLNEKGNQIIFFDMQALSCEIDSIELELRKLIDYYFLAKTELNLFYDTWLKKHFECREEKIAFRKAFEEKKEQDPYLKFFWETDFLSEAALERIEPIYQSFEKWLKSAKFSENQVK